MASYFSQSQATLFVPWFRDSPKSIAGAKQTLALALQGKTRWVKWGDLNEIDIHTIENDSTSSIVYE
jgi:hypothetical protein